MDKRLFFLLNMAQKKLFKHVDQVCERELDASVTQLAALMFVIQNEGCGQKELAAALSLNKSAITGLVTRMEANGLLARKASKQDARAVTLWSSEKGKKKLVGLKPLINALNSQFENEFSEEEMETIYRFLNFTISQF